MKRYCVLKYIFLSITIIFNIFLLVESGLPGSYSSLQSDFFSNIFAIFVNNNTTPSVNDIKLESIYFKDDITSLDIIYGTTSRLDVLFKPDNASNKGLTYTLSDSDDFNIIQQGNSFYIESYTYDSSALLTVTSKYDETISKSIVLNGKDLAKPENYNFTIANNNLSVGMSSDINIYYLDYAKEDQIDSLRYYNEHLLDFISSNEDIAYIDEYNVIHALSSGSTYIYEASNPSYKLKLDILENSSPLIYPSQLKINGDFNVGIYDLDYDIYNTLEAEFIGETPTDTSVTYIVSDPLYAKVSKDGKLYGYKKQGKVNIRAISNIDHNVYYDFEVSVNEVLPTSMEIKLSNLNTLNSVSLNNTLTISATFEPINTTNLEIGVRGYESYFDLINTGRQISLLAKNIGETTITVYSVANPLLSKDITITISAPQTIDEDNYDDFHSFIRKFIGHFFLYGINGILLFLTTFFFFKDKSKDKKLLFVLLISLISGFIMSGLSELVQAFTPDRGASFIDVLINFSGVVIFVLLCYGIIHLIRFIIKIKKKNNQKPQ